MSELFTFNGWGKPSSMSTASWHYFARGRSLCGTWGGKNRPCQPRSPEQVRHGMQERDQCPRCVGKLGKRAASLANESEGK